MGSAVQNYCCRNYFGRRCYKLQKKVQKYDQVQCYQRKQEVIRDSTSSDKKKPYALRIFQIKITVDDDPGKDDCSVTDILLRELQTTLQLRQVPSCKAVNIVRKSFDARVKRKSQQRSFNYVIDITTEEFLRCGGILSRKLLRKGNVESIQQEDVVDNSWINNSAQSKKVKAPVVIVGCGPAGLFAALELSSASIPVILLERGEAVEKRGKDIGALMVRRKLNADSNLCYGEGGAGTWSDGKLTTRIGRNSDPVRKVLQVFCHFGAPEIVLRTGKPHLGTNRLVGILKQFRKHLFEQGVDIRFGQNVSEILIKNGSVYGVRLKDGEEILSECVILAVGHSSRDFYRHLHNIGVALQPKPYAVGFRVEHPQELINEAQYGVDDSKLVMRGKGKIPVADYILKSQVNIQEEEGEEKEERQVYSFCMCPGGQIVPTSTDEEHLCINGMSFSDRSSKWANSAIVVGVGKKDWDFLETDHGLLAPLAFQELCERKAARMGGGNLVVPVQTVPDFLSRVISQESSLPSSSYRLGVRSAPLHELYPQPITSALSQALEQFNEKIDRYVSQQGLLHGVETRTSAPLCIVRNQETLESINTIGLFPAGEGAGYAGGIVSSAVDGMKVAQAIIQKLQ